MNFLKSALYVVLTLGYYEMVVNGWSNDNHRHNPNISPNYGNFRLTQSTVTSVFSCSSSTAQFSVNENDIDRRRWIQCTSGMVGLLCGSGSPLITLADDEVDQISPVVVSATGEIKQLFREGQAYEFQGNMAAAQRIYAKVTKIVPRFIYGWSSLGNTQVALGSLDEADKSYSTSVDLCRENNRQVEEKFGIRKCDDLYNLLLNRGVVRLNNNMPKDALKDLELSSTLRARPDAIILQNLARAKEVNGYYDAAERDYALAISMTSNEVAPFWLRSAMMQFQIGDRYGAFDLARRVENRFPEAPEVRAAIAAMLFAKGDTSTAQKYVLQIPDEQRRLYTDGDFLKDKLSWPPAMIDNILEAAKL